MSQGWKGVVDMTDLLDSPERPPSNAGRDPAPSEQADLLDYPSTAHRSSRVLNTGFNTHSPLRPSSRPNKPSSSKVLDSPSTDLDSQPLSYFINGPGANITSFGSSILKTKSSKKSSSQSSRSTAPRMGGYIQPGQGAFKEYAAHAQDSPFSQRARDSYGYDETGWPSWSKAPAPSTQSSQTSTRPTSVSDDDESDSAKEDREDFDLGNVEYTAQDFERHGDAEEQMRELLAGAVGDGEDDHGGDGDDTVNGFSKDMKLMPHQVRGVRWMRERESGRKRGGILADDMGLGKTVQTLARIVEGKPTVGDTRLYKGGTLIICPLAVMEQWATECRTKTEKGLLKVTTHHGTKRAKTGEELKKFDVVITTFQVLASEMGLLNKPGLKSTKSKKKSVRDPDSDSDSDVPLPIKKSKAPARRPALYELKWYRVVIDEAQNIKNHKTQAAKAAFELQAKFRWCLTGTPIQNNVEELYSLFKFLRAKPLDDWQVFRSRVSSEVKEGRTGVAMKRLHVILKAVMLRRTKNATIDGKPILNLPERNVEVVECEFDPDERAFYEALEAKTAVAFNKFAKAGTVMGNYTSVLSMLLRLRQACDHPSLVTKALGVDKDALENQPTKDSDDGEGDDLADLMSGLGMSAQKKCEICFTVLENQKAKQCPSCMELAEAALAKDTGDRLPPSSAKIRMVLQLLAEVEERGQKQQKTIVFSQFTSFLNLIEPFLQKEGIKYVRYDGTLRADQREDVLQTIRTSKSTRVILISFKAGSTGLNLTCCNNVIMTDLWWNPALEDQAFDRAHRLGQKLDVNIYKLTIASTVEDRILALQSQKRELAEAALSGTGAKSLKLTMKDIMDLFRTSKLSEDD